MTRMMNIVEKQKWEPVKVSEDFRPHKLYERKGYRYTTKMGKLLFELKLSQQQFADLCGSTNESVCFYVQGKRTPNLATWIKMKRCAKANGIELSDDVFDEEVSLQDYQVKTHGLK